jgi:hypothetical protein
VETEAGPDDVVEVELKDGTRLWMSVEDYRRDFGTAGRGDEAIVVSPVLPFRGGSRGPGQCQEGLGHPSQCCASLKKSDRWPALVRYIVEKILAAKPNPPPPPTPIPWAPPLIPVG